MNSPRLSLKQPAVTLVTASFASGPAGGHDGSLSVFNGTIKVPPRQKELASILCVETRHLRRWEKAEAAENRPCSRPYSHADLWHLYQRRKGKGWDRSEAARLGLLEIFERFDQLRIGSGEAHSQDARVDLVAMMLRSLAMDGAPAGANADGLPLLLGAGLIEAAKAQLRCIVGCPAALQTLSNAFLESAVTAEAKTGGR